MEKENDDRTFRTDFTSEGVSRLREQVNEKLKEFMGDYTDDTLVEYVIVLLKNGRRKDEAKSELNVFLGDDSDSFVSWLWDHLGSNLSLYVQTPELRPDGAQQINSAAGKPDEGTELQQMDSDAQKERKTSGKRRKREWRGLVRDTDETENPFAQGSVPDNINVQTEPRQKVDRTERSLSSRPMTEKKRRRHEERRPGKEVSEATASAPRRLLQFAVRDAVATSMPRLRSVISTATGGSFLEERAHRNQPRLLTATSAAHKAVAEAAEDAVKIRPPHNVFDRLGRATDISNTTDHLIEYRGLAEDGGVIGDFGDERFEIDLAYTQPSDDIMQQEMNLLPYYDDTVMSSDVRYVPEDYEDYRQQSDDNMLEETNLLDYYDDTIISSDLRYEIEDYVDFDVMDNRTANIYQPDTYHEEWVEDSLMLQNSVTEGTEERMRRRRIDLDQPAPRKIASSVNLSTRKPQYEKVRKVAEKMDNRKVIPDSNTVAAKSQARLMKKNNNPKVTLSGNAKPATAPQHESQQTQTPTGLRSTGPPVEDADSRTIFVSNVHFAATKDSLARHFNKSGEVLKVIISTDPTTGQPMGSAYIEFTRKEASEQALSFDGTSFMSRILKIVKKSSAQVEAASPVIWWPPRNTARVPFAGGVPRLYRPRIPIKHGGGGRSLQWKRGGAQPNVNPSRGGGAMPPSSTAWDSTERSITRARTEMT
ncbi:hypothetical protein MIMGU_mgv1a002184mg [Erythranthe guttata]|uniref:RRM domain-containing protein n=1 Tax=Erythranthe guttata TaxID=4155 RepID=A0A022QIK8_ERYGU|nr:hypothetical protein MIMGU_mgv1a002184mg [Erythranthe guttata]